MGEVKVEKFFQIGIVVADARRAAETLCAMCAIDPAGIRYVDLSEQNAPVKFRGRLVTAYMRLAMVQVAGVEFEFIQHTGGDVNSQKEFFDQHGPGIQHICLGVNDYAGMRERMRALGAETLVEGGSAENGFYCYMDLRKDTGLIVELYDAKLSRKKGLSRTEESAAIQIGSTGGV